VVPPGGATTRVPVASNMFSALSHFPATTTVPSRPTPAATALAAQSQRVAAAAAGVAASTTSPTTSARPPAHRPLEELVQGTQRYKFFKRPYVAAVDAALASV